MPTPSRTAESADAAPSFEQILEKLETIVRDLENKDLPLEKALAMFEEGVHLSRVGSSRLDAAERRIETLIRTESGSERVPMTEAGQ